MCYGILELLNRNGLEVELPNDLQPSPQNNVEAMLGVLILQNIHHHLKVVTLENPKSLCFFLPWNVLLLIDSILEAIMTYYCAFVLWKKIIWWRKYIYFLSTSICLCIFDCDSWTNISVNNQRWMKSYISSHGEATWLTRLLSTFSLAAHVSSHGS